MPIKQSKQRKPRKDPRPSRKKRQKGMCLEDRPVLEPNAAGIGIGAREILVAVPPDRDAHPVRYVPPSPRIYNKWLTGW